MASVPELVKKLCCRFPGDLCDLLRERHDVFVGVERRSVLQPVDLRVHFAGDLRVAVTHGDGQDTTEEIEVLVAF